MIDYKEMEKVIQDLNNYVEKLQKTSETQKKLDESIEELVKIKESIKDIEKAVGQYTKFLEELESKHDTIKSQFDTVLQDYKKLHSAFELLDIELKKINSQNESFDKSLVELKLLTNEIKNEFSKVQVTQKSILEQQNLLAKKNKIWFGILTGLIGIVLTLTIVGLFI